MQQADRQQILYLKQQVCDEKEENHHLRRECEVWKTRLEQIEFMPALDPEGEIRSIADLLDKHENYLY